MAANVAKIIQAAKKNGQRTLSEYDSKRIIAAYGIPVSRERLVGTLAGAKDAAKRIKYPVVLKGCSADAAHKTEKGLVAVGLDSQKALSEAFATIKKRAGKSYDGDYLVQEMVKGQREIMLGMTRDAQFGPSVMFGLGGIFTEILQDVAFRVAPIRKRDAKQMLGEIRGHRILDAVRGMKAVETGILVDAIVALGKIGLDHPEISEIDINPLIIRGDKPVAVDALVVLGE
jgi:acetate---CoA ligase (ADP-forming) subunit beta